jgi:hypothetical protein
MKNDYEIKDNKVFIFLNRKDGSILKTVISLSDFERVKLFPNKWYAYWEKDISNYYVRAHLKISKRKYTTIPLHRWILDAPDGLLVDHKNHDTLDNTRENLRIATAGENNQNLKGAKRNNQSGIRGVRFIKTSKKWDARFQVNKKPIFVGTFDTKEEAEKAIIAARKDHMPFSTEGDN